MHLDGQLHVQLLAERDHLPENLGGDGVLGAHHGEARLLGADQVVDGELDDLILGQIPVRADTHVDVSTPAHWLQANLLQQGLELGQPLIAGIGIAGHHLAGHQLNAGVALGLDGAEDLLKAEDAVDIFVGVTVQCHSISDLISHVRHLLTPRSAAWPRRRSAPDIPRNSRCRGFCVLCVPGPRAHLRSVRRV